nr:DUF932 domain-containing protein [unidentified bacterial endosymbiont]
MPSVFSEEKHESRSERYTYIPTITLLDNLQREGFQPFFACQTRVRDLNKRDHTKHMLRLRREGQITGKQVPEIILLNSHDGSSSYQILPGLFRFVCQNGLVCGETFGEVRVPVTASQILTPRRYEDRQDDLWSVFNRCQENLLKGGLPGRSAKGKRSHTRAVRGIDGDVKLNRALWVMAEELQQVLS